MTNTGALGRMNKQNVLLKEYEVCQQHINAIGTQSWQSVSIFFLVNAIVLGFVLSMQEHNNGSFVTVLVIGVAMSCIFWFWKLWVRRQQFVQLGKYVRMREIEEELGLWTNWYIWICENLNNNLINQMEYDSLPSEKREKIDELKKRYVKPAGYSGLQNMALIIIASWLFIIIREAILAFKLCNWFIS